VCDTYSMFNTMSTLMSMLIAKYRTPHETQLVDEKHFIVWLLDVAYHTS
jgi:hypothetical protein